MARYTLIQSGDFNAAENIGALAGDIQREGIVSGLGLSAFDPSVPEIDVAAGKTVHVIDSQTAEATVDDGTTVSEQRDQVQLVSHVDPQTVGLTDSTINELYLTPQPAVDDSPNVITTTTGDPTADALKIGEVDTTTDTVSERWNLITDDGTLSYPNSDAANTALQSLPTGVAVIDRSNDLRITDGGVSATTLEATGSITDPEGNTVTSLSDPVRVTEEASTFAESDITVTRDSVSVVSGSLQLASNIVDDFEDGDENVKSTEWSGWTESAENEFNVQNGTVISGSFSAEIVADATTATATATRISSIQTSPISFKIRSDGDTEDNTKGTAVDIPTLGKLRLQDSTNKILFEGNDTGQTWSPNTNYLIEYKNIDYQNDTVDVFVDGVNTGNYAAAGDLSNGIDTIELRKVTAVSTFRGYYDDILFGTKATTGDALITFDSGSPVDINSWDLATFQRTLDNETVTIDVEDSNGNVLKSDISKDTDISDIATSTDVQLRANLSRNDTSNNPTVDYLARRFTR